MKLTLHFFLCAQRYWMLIISNSELTNHVKKMQVFIELRHHCRRTIVPIPPPFLVLYFWDFCVQSASAFR